MKRNLFVLALFVAMLVGYFFPGGVHILPLNLITNIGIGVIFFLYGLKLSVGELRSGLSHYKLHLIVQLITFLVFPLLVLVFYPVFQGTSGEQWWLAFFYLAALPSTVSSAVVMVALARGNVSAAIFNASLSGLIGIAMTPFWLQFFLDASEGFHIGKIVLELLYQIILPLLVGLFLHSFLYRRFQGFLRKSSLFDKSIITLIVYSSFAYAAKRDIFASLGWQGFGFMILAILVLFFLVFLLTKYLGRIFRFSRENKIVMEFCGSKKSLVHGSAMGKIMFSSAQLSVFLLPIMLYHACQLVIIAVIAERYAKRKTLNDTPS